MKKLARGRERENDRSYDLSNEATFLPLVMRNSVAFWENRFLYHSIFSLPALLLRMEQ